MPAPEDQNELDQRIAGAVERAVREVRQELLGQLEQTRQKLDLLARNVTAPDTIGVDDLAEKAPPATATVDALPLKLKDALVSFDAAGSQGDLLRALLARSSDFASRVAVFLVRPGTLQGWGAIGFGDRTAALAELSVDLQEPGWAKLSRGQGCVRLEAEECAVLHGALGVPAANEAILVPLVLRNQIAAVLYADDLDSTDAMQVPMLQALTYVLALCIEGLPLRQREGTPTLGIQGQGDAAPEALPLWAADAEVAPHVEAEPEPVEAVVAVEAEPAPTSGEESDESLAAQEESPPVIEVAAEETPAPTPVDEGSLSMPAIDDTPEVETASIPLDSDALVDAVQPPPGPELTPPEAPVEVIPEPEPLPEPEPEPEPLEHEETPSFETTPTMTPPEPATVVPPASDAQLASEPAEPTTAAEAEPVAAVPPPSASGDTTEIAPPTDLDGPGWAFSAGGPEESGPVDDAQEEARRLARLLVTEIKLYNEEQVEEGRRMGDIRTRLEEDIERSRKIFDERVGEEVRGETDFFEEELVRILGGGDPNAL
jgi:hypothetical protein